MKARPRLRSPTEPESLKAIFLDFKPAPTSRTASSLRCGVTSRLLVADSSSLPCLGTSGSPSLNHKRQRRRNRPTRRCSGRPGSRPGAERRILRSDMDPAVRKLLEEHDDADGCEVPRRDWRASRRGAPLQRASATFESALRAALGVSVERYGWTLRAR